MPIADRMCHLLKLRQGQLVYDSVVVVVVAITVVLRDSEQGLEDIRLFPLGIFHLVYSEKLRFHIVGNWTFPNDFSC